MSKAPKTPFTRNSIACEYCRARRRKCQPPFPCKACRDAGIADCQVRDQARPQRKTPRQTNAINGTTYPERAQTIELVDSYLEQIYAQQTGRSIKLKLNEPPLHPLCDLDYTPDVLPALPSPPDPSVVDALATFLAYLLPYAGYFTPAKVEGLFQRWMTTPETLTPDQTALVLGCIASGYVRLQSRDAHGNFISLAPENRLDTLYFRHAVRTLERWGGESFTSLHALSTLWAYAIMTCPSKTIRILANWLVAQAQDLGIHQEQLSVAYGPADRADLMLIKVLYSHFWGTSLTGQPPVIRPQDLERTVVRARPVQAEDESSVALVPRRSLSELLLFDTKLLVDLHDTKIPLLTMEWLNDTEERWDTWCTMYINTGKTTGSRKTDPFLDILWDWGRIILRVPTLGDKRLATASMSVVSRSAAKIISVIYNMYTQELDDVNMVWQHLRSVVTCAHIALLSYWRYDMRATEAAAAVQDALIILRRFQVRWGQQVTDAIDNICEVARAIGVHLRSPESPLATSTVNPMSSPVYQGLSAMTPSLYETFDLLNGMELNGMQWSIDSTLFTQEL